MSVDRHAYYLQLKARGYYKVTCACGRTKSLQARICKFCASPRAEHQLVLQTCACGRDKSRYAKRCIECKRGLVKERALPVNANPYCPNPGLGGAECASRHPHRHCECGEVVEPERTLCDLCKQEAARIANKRLTRVA